MIVQPISFDAALYVALRMRALDVEEIFATRWADDRVDLAHAAAARAPLAWAAGLDGGPIACIGAVQCWPGVWEAWMYATDDFDKIGKRLTRFAHRAIIPAVRAAGGHRLQAHSMEGHTVAHRWLDGFGAVREATLRAFGRGGQDFHVYRLDLG